MKTEDGTPWELTEETTDMDGAYVDLFADCVGHRYLTEKDLKSMLKAIQDKRGKKQRRHLSRTEVGSTQGFSDETIRYFQRYHPGLGAGEGRD